MHTELARTNFYLTEHCRLFPELHCKAKDEAQINKEEVAVRGFLAGSSVTADRMSVSIYKSKTNIFHDGGIVDNSLVYWELFTDRLVLANKVSKTRI